MDVNMNDDLHFFVASTPVLYKYKVRKINQG